MNKIYFDHSATTPVLPEVADAMTEVMLKNFGNPSSVYETGRAAKAALEEARATIASLLGADDPREIIFTAGGSESNNLAVKGVADAKAKRGNHIVTSTVEHPAIMEPLAYLEKHGFTVTYVPVDAEGLVDPERVAAAITDQTILITIMQANNVVGTIQPIAEIAALVRPRGVAFHTDAVQAVGNTKIDVNELGVDMLSISGHKFHGPKGVGALYIRKGTRINPVVHGGGQERGKRSGTENVPGIVGLATAMAIAEREREEKAQRLRALRERLVVGVMGSVEDVIYLGHPIDRLPGNACFSFKFIEGESLILNLDMLGFAASSGSACSSHSLEPSHVILAMGYSAVDAHGSLRITMGRSSTEAEVDELISVLPGVVSRLRAMSPFRAGETPEMFMAEHDGEDAHEHHHAHEEI